MKEMETRVVEIVQGEARRVLAQRALNFLSANSQDTAMGLGWLGFGVGWKLRAVNSGLSTYMSYVSNRYY